LSLSPRGMRSVPLPLLKAPPADANCVRFGFASRQMSLWSPDRNLETAATGFEEASKGPTGPEHERSSARGDLSFRWAGPISTGRLGHISRVLPEHRGGSKSEMASPIKSGQPGPDIGAEWCVVDFRLGPIEGGWPLLGVEGQAALMLH
jgi:hypothetical protein